MWNAATPGDFFVHFDVSNKPKYRLQFFPVQIADCLVILKPGRHETGMRQPQKAHKWAYIISNISRFHHDADEGISVTSMSPGWGFCQSERHLHAAFFHSLSSDIRFFYSSLLGFWCFFMVSGFDVTFIGCICCIGSISFHTLLVSICNKIIYIC